jgi:hypothetical protein
MSSGTICGAGVKSALRPITASRMAVAVSKRLAISRSRARTMAASTLGGISRRRSRGKGYQPSRMLAKILAWLSPSKGVRPHSISYKTTPAE